MDDWRAGGALSESVLEIEVVTDVRATARGLMVEKKRLRIPGAVLVAFPPAADGPGGE